MSLCRYQEDNLTEILVGQGHKTCIYKLYLGNFLEGDFLANCTYILLMSL